MKNIVNLRDLIGQRAYALVETPSAAFYVRPPSVSDVSSLLDTNRGDLSGLLDDSKNLNAPVLIDKYSGLIGQIVFKCVSFDAAGLEKIDPADFMELPVGVQIDVLDAIWKSANVSSNTVKKILLNVYQTVISLSQDIKQIQKSPA